MNEAGRREVARKIAHQILVDLRRRVGLDLPEFQAMQEIETFWANKVIFDLLPDSLEGTSFRDRLPLTYVDQFTPAPVTAEVIDDL